MLNPYIGLEVVALVVMGPDKLPKIAKQIGGLWGDFRKFREKLESEVRGNFPDIPSTDKIAQAVRSPLSFLDTLADTHGSENGTTAERSGSGEPPIAEGSTADPPSDTNRPVDSVTFPEPLETGRGGNPGSVVHSVRSTDGALPSDLGMN
jgi:Sec-independent protein translocase protein TatA